MDLVIERTTTPTDDVRSLIAEREDSLAAEYPPEQRHGLALDAIFQPHIQFFVARVAGAAVGRIAALQEHRSSDRADDRATGNRDTARCPRAATP